MKTTRRRLHAIKRPSDRIYRFRTSRFEGFTKTNKEGHSRAKVVASGYGTTPQRAIIAARKRPFRRDKPEPKNARRLAVDRRYYNRIAEEWKNRNKFTPREAARRREVFECEHNKVETHPLAYSSAWRCTKCNIRGGIKPGRPDPLRNYY